MKEYSCMSTGQKQGISGDGPADREEGEFQGAEPTTATAAAVVLTIVFCPSPPPPPLTVPFPGVEHPRYKHCRGCCLVIIFLIGVRSKHQVSHFSVNVSFITIQASYNLVMCQTWRITGFLDLIFVVVWIFAPVHWEIQKSTGQQEAGSLETLTIKPVPRRRGCGFPACVNSTSSNFSKTWPP